MKEDDAEWSFEFSDPKTTITPLTHMNCGGWPYLISWVSVDEYGNTLDGGNSVHCDRCAMVANIGKLHGDDAWRYWNAEYGEQSHG